MLFREVNRGLGRGSEALRGGEESSGDALWLEAVLSRDVARADWR
jgi:hypothetical protein